MNGSEFIDNYTRWIKDNSFIRNLNNKEDHYIVTTPFVDPHNDHIDIYVMNVGNDTYVLSDDGYTMKDLMMGGTDVLSTARRKKTFEVTLNRYGVTFDRMSYELSVVANNHNIASKKHALMQCMMAIADLYVISRENVTSYFKEDLEAFLRTNNVAFARSIKLPGKSGFDHSVDFLVPSSATQPERLIQAINTPRKDQVMSAIFSFSDVSAIREDAIKPIVIYNDENSALSSESSKALNEYGITNYKWSQKEEILEALALR